MNRARTTLALLLVIPAAFVWACGGDDNNDGGLDSGGNDGTVGNDTGTKDGSGNDGTTGDTGTNDTGTNDTGASDTGSSDGGLPTGFSCSKPADCDAGFCCGTIVFNGGQLPNCNLADASSACNATCKSNVTLSCQATETVRACIAKADCADAGTGYTDCCNVPFGDAAVEFCWSKTYANLINGASCL